MTAVLLEKRVAMRYNTEKMIYYRGTDYGAF